MKTTSYFPFNEPVPQPSKQVQKYGAYASSLCGNSYFPETSPMEPNEKPLAHK